MTSDDDVDALLVAYLQAELPAEVAASLKARLVTDAGLARRLMMIAVEEATLIRWSRGALAAREIDAAEVSLRTLKDLESEVGQAVLAEEASSKPFRSMPWPKWGEMTGSGILFSFLGLVVVGVIGIGLWLRRSEDLPGGPPIARVVRLDQAVWAQGHVAVRSGAGIPQGWDLQLAQGTAEIEFPNGAHLVLTGPAELQLTDGMHGLLRRGQVAAYVPPSAIGYTINTVAVDVRDMGTRFGVRIDPQNGTEVHVFEGEVETRSATPANNHSEKQSLTMTQAAKFDQSGKLSGWLSPAYDDFAEKRLAPGVIKTSKNVRWLTKAPDSLMLDAFTHDQNVYLLLERHGVELVGPMAVTFAQPLQGTKSAYESHVRMLPAGTRVDSYLLHFNSSSRIGIAEGEIEFERPIVGVIARGTQLNYSDKILGLEGLAYERRDASLRGLKSGTKEVPSPDVILFGTSYNTVGIHCEAGKHTVAEVRILVQSK